MAAATPPTAGHTYAENPLHSPAEPQRVGAGPGSLRRARITGGAARKPLQLRSAPDPVPPRAHAPTALPPGSAFGYPAPISATAPIGTSPCLSRIPRPPKRGGQRLGQWLGTERPCPPRKGGLFRLRLPACQWSLPQPSFTGRARSGRWWLPRGTGLAQSARGWLAAQIVVSVDGCARAQPLVARLARSGSVPLPELRERSPKPRSRQKCLSSEPFREEAGGLPGGTAMKLSHNAGDRHMSQRKSVGTLGHARESRSS